MVPDAIDRLVKARSDHPDAPFYDETLWMVVDVVAKSGSIGKADIGALLFWKRIRASAKWTKNLQLRSAHEVREITARATIEARDMTLSIPDAARRAAAILTELPGSSFDRAREE